MGNLMYDLPPTRQVQNGPIDAQKVSIFQKGWRSVHSYSGKPYDLLYDKARIFISHCQRLQITEDQYHAVFPDILVDRALAFYTHYISPDRRWDEMYNILDTHFNTTINHNVYFSDWTTLSFARLRRENPDQTLIETLESLLDRLQLVQRALGKEYQGEIQLRTTVTRACRGVPELETALFQQKPTCEALFSDLRASIQVALDREPARQFHLHDDHADINFVDRRYVSNFKNRQKQSYERRGVDNKKRSTKQVIPYHTNHSTDRAPPRQPFRFDRTNRQDKKCFICKREGCWSTNHPESERKRARDQYLQACEVFEQEVSHEDFDAYLQEYEGHNPVEVESMDDDELDSEDEVKSSYLMDLAFLHRTTGEDVFSAPITKDASQFILEDP
jgi:hypothetical protein